MKALSLVHLLSAPVNPQTASTVLHLVNGQLLADRGLLPLIHEAFRGSSLIHRQMMQLFTELPTDAFIQSMEPGLSSSPRSRRSHQRHYIFLTMVAS